MASLEKIQNIEGTYHQQLPVYIPSFSDEIKSRIAIRTNCIKYSSSNKTKCTLLNNVFSKNKLLVTPKCLLLFLSNPRSPFIYCPVNFMRKKLLMELGGPPRPLQCHYTACTYYKNATLGTKYFTTKTLIIVCLPV